MDDSWSWDSGLSIESAPPYSLLMGEERGAARGSVSLAVFAGLSPCIGSMVLCVVRHLSLVEGGGGRGRHRFRIDTSKRFDGFVDRLNPSPQPLRLLLLLVVVKSRDSPFALLPIC